MEIGKKVWESGVMSKGKSHWSWYGVVEEGRSWTCNILKYDILPIYHTDMVDGEQHYLEKNWTHANILVRHDEMLDCIKHWSNSVSHCLWGLQYRSRGRRWIVHDCQGPCSMSFANCKDIYFLPQQATPKIVAVVLGGFWIYHSLSQTARGSHRKRKVLSRGWTGNHLFTSSQSSCQPKDDTKKQRICMIHQVEQLCVPHKP